MCAIFLSACSQPAPSVTYIGTKTPSQAKAVGDVVFNDGSATPYSVIKEREDDATTGIKLTQAEKDAVIAVIFYVGADLNNGSDTTTVRTLGAGVKNASKKFCESSANGFGVELTGLVCSYSGSTGNYTFTGVKNGKDSLQTIITELGNYNDTDTASNYPAFMYAKNYKDEVTNLGSYANGWYVPSIAEMYWLTKASEPGAISKMLGNSGLSDATYTTSSQADGIDVRQVAFTYPQSQCWIYDKCNNYVTWPIREF